ncbi:MAG: DUF502 domain-containing protein [Gammaproteobacteria bacterium]|nr:DUF502 domain-containing protein [Gammaproteobacteria bacterium]
MKYLRSALLAGLVVWLPILVTVGIVSFIVQVLDHSIALLPATYQPKLSIPGLGVVFSLVVLLITGIIATNILGERLVRWSELLLDKIPLVRSIYNMSKQIIQTVVSTDSQAFRKVVLIQYPRKGLWSLAFQTGSTSDDLSKDFGKDTISVFVPTTPNPTAGFLLVVPKDEILELSVSSEDALKYIVSLGVMQPGSHPKGKKKKIT